MSTWPTILAVMLSQPTWHGDLGKPAGFETRTLPDDGLGADEVGGDRAMSAFRSFWRSFRWYVAAAMLSPLVYGCPPKPDVPPPITPADVPDGACQAAQERLERLGCQEARTPAGEPWGEACERARARGASWCPVAVSAIDYCSQFEPAAEGRRGGC